MLKYSKRDFITLMRDLHRDLGYLMVGICLVYGMSGFMLNRMKRIDPSYRVESINVELQKNADKQTLQTYWNQEELPKISIIRSTEDGFSMLYKGGEANYDKETGELSYVLYSKRPIMYWVNLLHYNNVNGWKHVANVFAISLIFFAVSGLFLVKGKKGLAGRGKWLLLVGFLLPIVFLIFS